jgi:hypothetical protein
VGRQIGWEKVLTVGLMRNWHAQQKNNKKSSFKHVIQGVTKNREPNVEVRHRNNQMTKQTNWQLGANHQIFINQFYSQQLTQILGTIIMV